MNLGKINLNLLVALDALLSERQVTRAALKVHITQSAMSIALSQLRQLLKDEILVRDRGEMKPTRRAQELQPRIRQILEEIKKIVHELPVFDPATTPRTFRIGMTDYTEFLVLPNLLATLAKIAPNITIKIINLNLLDHYEIFEKEQLDLAVGVFFEGNTPLESKRLLTETAVCVAHKDHPLMKKRLTLKAFLQAKHIAINLHSMKVLGRIDKALHDLGVERDIVLATPHLVTGFHLVRNSPYLMASMRHLAEKLIKPFGLAMQELPFAVEPLDIMMAWHKSLTSDPAHSWLREQIYI